MTAWFRSLAIAAVLQIVSFAQGGFPGNPKIAHDPRSAGHVCVIDRRRQRFVETRAPLRRARIDARIHHEVVQARQSLPGLTGARIRDFERAQQLNPDDWNYHRQDWSFDKSKEMTNFMAKVRKLGTRPYYDPVEFPQAKDESGADK